MDEEEYISHVLFLSLSVVCKWNTTKGESGEITEIHSNLLQINSHTVGYIKMYFLLQAFPNNSRWSPASEPWSKPVLRSLIIKI